MNIEDRVILLEAAAKIPVERLADVCRSVHSLFTERMSGVTKRMSGKDQAILLEAAAEIPGERLVEVCRNVRPLFTERMSEEDGVSLLRAVANIPVERWEDVYRNVHPLFTPRMSGKDQASLLEAAAKVPANQLTDVCGIPSIRRMSVKDKASFLETAAKVSDQQVLNEIYAYACQLSRDVEAVSDQSRILRLLGTTACSAPQCWKEVYSNAVPLLDDIRRYIEQEEHKILQVLAGLPVEQLVDVCNKAHLRFEEHTTRGGLPNLLREITSQAGVEDGHNIIHPTLSPSAEAGGGGGHNSLAEAGEELDKPRQALEQKDPEGNQ
jgi:hypothetical protein